jgi:hypothetical protein
MNCVVCVVLDAYLIGIREALDTAELAADVKHNDLGYRVVDLWWDALTHALSDIAAHRRQRHLRLAS